MATYQSLYTGPQIDAAVAFGYDPDTTPIAGSNKGITSGGVGGIFDMIEKGGIELESGSFSSGGAKATNANRARNAQMIPAAYISTVSVSPPYQIRSVLLYNNAGTLTDNITINSTTVDTSEYAQPFMNVIIAKSGGLDTDISSEIATIQAGMSATLTISQKADTTTVNALERSIYNGLCAVTDNVISSTNVLAGYYWSNVTGLFNESANFACIPYLIPVSGSGLYISETNSYVYITCFDKDKTFLGSVQAYNRDSVVIKQAVLLDNTAYVGLSINSSTDRETSVISVRKLHPVDTVEYPYTNPEYVASDNHIAGSTAFTNNTNYVAIMMVVDDTTPIYVNETLATNVICFNASGSKITNTNADRSYSGKVYTVPTGTRYVWLNVDKRLIDGTTSVVFSKMRKNKSVLCIGDSITYLDGRHTYNNATLFYGWQKKLSLAGYDVQSAGYSGYTYAVVDGHGSIYTQIVTNEYDVSGYDYIILFGGTNDVIYDVPLGTRTSVYTTTTFDPATFNGALSGIIS